MLDSLLIRNFRLFKEFTIERLSRVNLFVGKNNSGKSCLLEALRVYASNARLSVLPDLISAREEDWGNFNEEKETRLMPAFENPLRHLFYRYRFPEAESDGIEIGSATNEADRVHIHLRAYQYAENQEGRRRRAPVKLQDIQSANVQIGLELDRTGLWVSLSEDLESLKEKLNRDPLAEIFAYRPIKYTLQAIPPQSLNTDTIAKLWDNINLTDFDSEVISCLQMIEPRVKGIAFVGEQRNRRIPIVRLKGSAERIPLKSLGDGMVRLLHISLTLVNARDGFLLIDEFENGIHWTVLPKLWEMIFRFAEQLNVQVFATTHSRDCVRGFYEVWSKHEEKGSFHRLDPDPERGVRSTSYTCEILSDALETGVEVR